MPANPRLKQVNRSSPLRPLVDDLNHAVSSQSQISPGTGFGMNRNSITRTSQDWMRAFTSPDGIPAATLKDPNDKKKGRKSGSGVAYEQTVEVDDDGDVWIVPAGPDDVTEIPCFNDAVGVEVPGSTLVYLEKRFGLWYVYWWECDDPS